MYTWKSSDEASKADFVLYLVCGAWFFFDLYTRTTKIKGLCTVCGSAVLGCVGLGLGFGHLT
jgi:hypothetical protein